MKVAWFALLVLAGTTLASPAAALQARTPPQAGSEQARELYDLVKKGLQSWGLAGVGGRPGGRPGGPSPKMPGGLPELNRPHPPKEGGVPGTPGHPLGPRKKQGRIYPRRQSCAKKKRGVRCTAGRASRYPKLRLNGRGGVMVAFATLSPHAHGILAAIESWDNPIGAAVAWFDGAMTSLQEAIGGKHVPEIDGNELKLWLICLFRGDNPANPDAVDRACRRRRDAPLEEQKQQQAIDGLNQVAELCEKVEEEEARLEGKMKSDVLALCDKYAETLESLVDANAGLVLLGEWARARTLNNQDVEDSDRAVVARFIQQGAFGPAVAANQTEAGALASLYVAHMSAYAVLEVEDDGSEVPIDHTRPPAWLALLQMGAGFVPEDRAAVDEALALLADTPHLRHLDKEARQGGGFDRVQTCWDHAGLLLFQPRRWDLIAAGMTYLEGKLRDANSDLACAPCLAPAGYWVLRCGSAVP